jgi:hypothetical protein
MVIARNATSARLLSAYDINPPGDRRLMRHPHGTKGIPLKIDAADDPYFGRNIQLTIGRRRSTGPCPLAQTEAERMVEEFRLAHLLPNRFSEDMTLVHLLVKCAHLYDEAGLAALHLRCHLTPRGYSVNDVQMISKSAIRES